MTNQTISSLTCTAGTGVLITPVGFESTEAILCSSREWYRRSSFKPRQFQSKICYRHGSFKPRQFQFKECYRHGSFKPRQFQFKERVPSLMELQNKTSLSKGRLPAYTFSVLQIHYIGTRKIRNHSDKGCIGWAFLAFLSASPRPSILACTSSPVDWAFVVPVLELAMYQFNIRHYTFNGNLRFTLVLRFVKPSFTLYIPVPKIVYFFARNRIR